MKTNAKTFRFLCNDDIVYCNSTSFDSDKTAVILVVGNNVQNTVHDRQFCHKLCNCFSALLIYLLMKCLSRQRRLRNIFVYSGSRKISCSINDILHLCEDHCEKRDGKNSQKYLMIIWLIIYSQLPTFENFLRGSFRLSLSKNSTKKGLAETCWKVIMMSALMLIFWY